MAKVFISYSSKDDQFVKRLSTDLLKHQVPVWLDAYELSIGDSLPDIIFQGIDDCPFILVVFSAIYKKSPWTSREFEAVLEKEQRDKKKYLIPVRIDEHPLPSEIEERIRVNLSANYDSEMRKLVRFFKSEHINISSIPISERQIVFNFKSPVEVDVLLLKNLLFDLHKNPESEIGRKQLFFTNLGMIDEVFGIARQRMDKWTGDIALSLQFERHSLKIESLIDDMHRGILIILNQYKNYNHIELLSTSIFWFLKAIMGSIYAYILIYTDPEETLRFGLRREDLAFSPFGYDETFKKFYSVNEHASLIVFNDTNHFVFWADKALSEVREISKYGKLPFAEMVFGDLVYKYFIPQNVFVSLFNDKVPLMNLFQKYMISNN
ncbi:toll/interleukin-1 receptor domain-containing protein [Mucilaginibacter celer]|uniref:TIR domain-containing protein n=1 Tax=Mucilaginibacter celer TaxID=2305508 RepID=A0A494VT39_9SPHI|nr:toll/interleukin-1 receptor domain-containing protein [Mucilaginibacter celer]AYL98114.1 TIR domain-containing protein [Mucilaginibacter celer]